MLKWPLCMKIAAHNFTKPSKLVGDKIRLLAAYGAST
jgi:hypothetical protein